MTDIQAILRPKTARKLTSAIALNLLAVAVSATVAAAQQDMSQVTIKITQVTPGIYMLGGGGGNIGLSVGSDNAFMIDDQYAPLTPKIKAAIATVSAKPVQFLMNTHWHGDHVGGNENMAGEGAIIVAHDNVRRRMGSAQFLAAFNTNVPASPKAALPIITFSENISLYVNGDSVRAIHVRSAHTDGDAIVVFQKADVVHMGDIFFNGMYPFIDISSGGSVDGIISAVDKVLLMSTDKTKFIPGHGPLASRADLVRYRSMLKTARDRVAQLITQKRSLAQAVAAKPTADLDSVWGKGFLKPDPFVTILYGDLARSGKPGKR